MTIRHFVVVEAIILLIFFRIYFSALKKSDALAIAVAILYPFAFNKIVLLLSGFYSEMINKSRLKLFRTDI